MKQKWFTLGLILLISAVFFIAACGPAPLPDPTPTAPAADPLGEQPAPTGPLPTEVEAGDYTTTDSGLQYYDLTDGEGDSPKDGDIITVNYSIWLQDGTQLIDSTFGSGQTIDFILGSEQVFAGWNEGVMSMKPGGTRQMLVPSDLGLGAEGAGIIPPDADLILEVELVAFRTPPAPTTIDGGEFTTTESGLQYYDLAAGEGEIPTAGANVSVNFTIWLQDGTRYVAGSEENGQPFEFVLGSGAVFPGWDECVSTMQVGGKRQVIIPSALALGEQGGGGIVPPNANLIMEVELLEIRQPAAQTEVDPADYLTTDSGLQYYDIVVGEGDTPQVGQTVVVHYSGWLEDGTKFDSSVDRGQPFEFVLGTGGVIAGWDEGVATMQVGGKRQLRVPASLAYGEVGAGGVIPPNATLIFDVELLEIK